VAGRDPGEATQNFLDPLQRAVSCVCPDVLIASGYGPRPEPNVVFFDGGRPARLRGGSRLLFRMRIEFVYVQVPDHRGPWRVAAVGYWYTLETQGEQELFAYHWHPNALGEITYPHLHLGPAARVGHDGFTKAHMPTGRVDVEDILRLSIAHFDVAPQRTDWRDVLDATQAAREALRGW
jgi:hypothetical protein